MSLKNDIETLYISTLERYAAQHQIDVSQAHTVFVEHFVHENMLSQHEYLHQIPFEEVMAYVTSLIENSLIDFPLYHGSVSLFEAIDLNKSKDRRDFGKGFYTTVLETQAVQWGRKLAQRERKNNYYVYQYQFMPKPDLRIKRFYGMDLNWLEFIKTNRIEGGCKHEYDIVIGPVADDDTLPTLLLYLDGTINANTAIEMLKYNQVNNQISFHTQVGLTSLQFAGRQDYV